MTNILNNLYFLAERLDDITKTQRFCSSSPKHEWVFQLTPPQIQKHHLCVMQLKHLNASTTMFPRYYFQNKSRRLVFMSQPRNWSLFLWFQTPTWWRPAVPTFCRVHTDPKQNRSFLGRLSKALKTLLFLQLFWRRWGSWKTKHSTLRLDLRRISFAFLCVKHEENLQESQLTSTETCF